MAESAEPENIAVCIRVRPPNEREAQDASVLSVVPRLSLISLVDEQGQPLGPAFQYDHIFDADSDARAIYAQTARRIVRSSLHGINGTIFAYGQTSSGKTFTMQGDGHMPFDGDESSRPGVLQLAVEDIFSYIESCQDRDFLLRVSYLEIYNEVVKDLLNPTESGNNLKLREDPRKGVYVECKEQIITNYEDIVTLLQTGNQHRTVGQTAMNDRSSRSHSVFRIVIESKQKPDSRRLSEEDVNGAVLVASLNLVDLAGSESLRHTGAEGIRQREAGNINKSLLTLARVINSLASGGSGQNAPFRDSKLTRLLQTSLGGNTRTLIICCVTPSERYVEETKSTLQFAARAKDIKTSATVNEVLDDQTQLRRLKREVHDLKKLVDSNALDALKAENEALLSEKNHNKEEMACLMGLILSSASVTKATTSKKRKHRNKWARDTWGPGDFPSNLKALGPLSPNLHARKRHFPSKENVDPQILYRVHEDIPALQDFASPAFASMEKRKSTSSGTKASNKPVLDVFASVLRSYREGNVEDAGAAAQAVANEKCASLDDIERARVLELLGELRTLMSASKPSEDSVKEKAALEREVEELRAKLEDQNNKSGACDCSDNASKAGALVQEIMAELVSTQESVASEKERSKDLATQLENAQQMAAEELNALRLQLETLQLESATVRQQFADEKRQLETTLQSFESGLLQPDGEEQVDLRKRNEELEELVKEMRTSQTVLRLAAAERDEEIASLKSRATSDGRASLEAPVTCLEEQKALLQEKISEDDEESTPTLEDTQEPQQEPQPEQMPSGSVEKLAGELKTIMEELAQLQSDHERAAVEKEELEEGLDRMTQELEISQRQGYEMSEALMEKEHIAKVTQAQLDAKVMTISQMGTKHSKEIEELQQTIKELTAEKQRLTTKIQALEAADGGDDNVDSDMMEVGTEQSAKVDTDGLIDQLTKQLSAAELELAETKERLVAVSTGATEQSELEAAYNALRMQYELLQMSNEDTAKVRSDAPAQTDESSIEPLNEEFKRMANSLRALTQERDDCVDELRALEAQLMEVSEEKMKLAVAADERDCKIRHLQEQVSASAEQINALQAELDAASSAKQALEDRKAQLEQDVEEMQKALTSLQADHDVVMEQMKYRPARASGGESDELLQTRLEQETRLRERLELDVKSYEETLAVLRNSEKDSSHTIADLTEQLRALQTAVTSASNALELKDKELATLTDALTRAKEEQVELRFQRQQRMATAEAKEMALEEKVASLEQQLQTLSTGVTVIRDPTQQTELVAAKERETALQDKVETLEAQLAETREELKTQDATWHKKQALAEKEFARMAAEQQQLRAQLSALESAASSESPAQQEERRKLELACEELKEQKDAAQHELETSNASWEAKQQEMQRQLNSIREQFHEAEEELEDYKKNADAEIRRLHAVVEQSETAMEEMKRSATAREEELASQVGEQEQWQSQVKSRQEALQAKCDELDEERRVLHEKYAALEAERSDVEQQLRDQLDERSQQCATAQAQQLDAEQQLKELRARMEMAQSDVDQRHDNLADELKAAQTEASQSHNRLAEAQVAKERLEQLVEKQKARIDKLEKVKMTTETLELFRRLKSDRHALQVKVQRLEKDVAASACEERALAGQRDDKLQTFKQQIEELRDAVRAEKQHAADLKTQMRAALRDEREKAEHEIQDMQALLKDKIDQVEALETETAALRDDMAKLRENDQVSFLEKENLDLMVENRRLKARLNSSADADKENDPAITGTFDASAAEAAQVLGDEAVDTAEQTETPADVVGDGTSPPNTPEASPARAGGFLLSTTELNAIASDSQEEPKEDARPECHQQ